MLMPSKKGDYVRRSSNQEGWQSDHERVNSSQGSFKGKSLSTCCEEQAKDSSMIQKATASDSKSCYRVIREQKKDFLSVQTPNLIQEKGYLHPDNIMQHATSTSQTLVHSNVGELLSQLKQTK